MGILKIYEHFSDPGVFTIEELKTLFKHEQVARNTIHRLIKEGYAGRIKNGLYYLIPLGIRGKSYLPDRYITASKLSNNYCLSYHTALELHGIAYSAWNTIYISSPVQFKTFSFRGCEYRSVFSQKIFGVEEMLYSETRLKVTDLEKTLLDCIHRMDLAGGLEEFLKSIEMISSLNWERLYQYLEEYNDKGLGLRTGYILSLWEERLRPSSSLPPYDSQGLKKLLEILSQFKNKKAYYLYPWMQKGRRGRKGEGEGKLDSKWNILVPKNIDVLIVENLGASKLVSTGCYGIQKFIILEK